MRKIIAIVIWLVTTSGAFAAESKPAPLNTRQARTSPDWITNGVIYQIQPRAFTPEGTLKAAAARLPKVAELGATIVYLCPVFVADDDPDPAGWSPRQVKSGMNNPRNPYRIKDYYHVDPEYGTDADLKAFVAVAHRLRLRVMLDMVYLHCGPNAVFLAEHPDFIKRDRDGKPVTAAWHFPALNLANPALREYLWKNMEYWVREFDVDGFRCDVADGIPLDFWVTARERLEKIRPDVAMLAEGTRREDQLKAFDLDYGWKFTWDDAATVRATWEKMHAERPRGGARFARFIDNHDIANDGYDNRIEKTWGARRVNAVLVALFTLDGVPFLYNGQEVADAARHSIYARLPVNWANGDKPAGKARLALCHKLCAMHRAEPALTRGEVVWLDNDAPGAVLSYLRRSGDGHILTIVNLADRPVKVHVAVPSKTPSAMRMLLSDNARCSENSESRNGIEFEFGGYGYYVGKCLAGINRTGG